MLDLAFYGDLFLPDRGGPSTKSGDATSLLDLMDEKELSEVSEALADVVSAGDLAVAEAEVGKAYTRTPRWAQALLRAVDRRCGAAAGVLYLGVLRQVRHYLTDGDLKTQVDARVADTVGTSCRVLIGHSLGSVVAYEYVRQHPGQGVQLLVTLGSPLGLRMVRERLQVEQLAVPRWVNVRDVRDPVACAGELRRWWPQIDERDELVVDNSGDAHAIERYLNRRATGEVLISALPHLVAA
ncbi:hypothetical protein DLJ47_28830 [Micromonospora sp. S4605]|uniref:hypothetical protein n=1 Tax=Micromonospora sp. S4605 TaxID=1420897 RepID=UPI000D6F5BD5|nr:hypothetical protein [Micromonospora sp. S4605]PWU48196.1 hypothetical protein DLJ47_28830 [Micromonospora sp. S4605]